MAMNTTEQQNAWAQFQNDFDAMTDSAIEHEVRNAEEALERAEDWLEAVAAWKAAGKPRRAA